MCDIRLFRSARMDYETAKMIWENPYYDEIILNNAAYHLQQAVEKVLKGALECIGVTVPNVTNGIRDTLRDELQDPDIQKRLLACLPEANRACSVFELNCYYIMFQKKL